MLFRAFYALPKTITGPDGQPVNALLGTANLVLREVELHQPRAVVLCFGPDAAAYRTELYPAYHAEREEAMPDELPDQFTASGPFFEAFGWTVATSADLEADDLLGTYARREAEAGGQALILTGDSECVISVEPPDVLLPGFNNGNATTHSAYLASMPVEELVSAVPMAADDLSEYKGWSTGWKA